MGIKLHRVYSWNDCRLLLAFSINIKMQEKGRLQHGHLYKFSSISFNEILFKKEKQYKNVKI